MLETDGEGKVLETDQYGRDLFIYTAGGIHFYGICQFHDDDDVYCYEDYCFIISHEEYALEKDALQNLKLINDWDTPLSLEKASNVKVSETRESSDYDWIGVGDIITNHIMEEGEKRDNVSAVDIDANGNELFFATIYSRTGISRYYFILLPQKSDQSESCFLEIQNIFDYAGQMHEFKVNNGWDFS
jgi:hypothetical protein